MPALIAMHTAAGSPSADTVKIVCSGTAGIGGVTTLPSGGLVDNGFSIPTVTCDSVSSAPSSSSSNSSLPSYWVSWVSPVSRIAAGLGRGFGGIPGVTRPLVPTAGLVIFTEPGVTIFRGGTVLAATAAEGGGRRGLPVDLVNVVLYEDLDASFVRGDRLLTADG